MRHKERCWHNHSLDYAVDRRLLSGEVVTRLCHGIRRIARVHIDHTSKHFLLCGKPSRGACRTSGHVTRLTFLPGNTVRLATGITDDAIGGSSQSCWEASWARDEGQSPRPKGPRAWWGSWLGGSQSLPTIWDTWASAVGSPIGVHGGATEAKWFPSILQVEAPDGLSWHLLGANSGGMAPSS